MPDNYSEAFKRRFVESYAVGAVQSGRLTPQAAVDEALAAWDVRVAAEQEVYKILEAMHKTDVSCPSCSAEPGGIHAEWCELIRPVR